MAFGARRIYPIDLAASKAVGVSLPFNGNAVFKPTYTTREAIKTNLINFLLTGQGERVFNPTFGAGLRKFVFQQINTEGISEIESYILSVIEKYFPNIQGVAQVQPVPDQNTIFITITYSILNTGINDTIQINLTNG
jgi:phage baseplate assembly protein W